jgi:hypothetical protein
MVINVPMWLVWVALVFVAGPIAMSLLFWFDDARRVWDAEYASVPAWRLSLLLSLAGLALAAILGLVSARLGGSPSVEFAAVAVALASVSGAAFGGGLFLLAAIKSRIAG